VVNYFLNRTVGGDSLDPQRRVPANEQAITSARAHKRSLLAVREEQSAELTAHDATVAETRVDTAAMRERRRDLVEALGHIDHGVPANVGVLPELSPFVGKPGLIETRAAIKQLEEELKAWVLLRDDHEPRPYRLREGMRHMVDGKRVLPGEIVMLTARGYRAFADKFEPVEGVPATT
jgi:hypothetical protein